MRERESISSLLVRTGSWELSPGSVSSRNPEASVTVAISQHLCQARQHQTQVWVSWFSGLSC